MDLPRALSGATLAIEVISGRSAGPQGDVPALSAQRHRAFEKERTSATGILNSRASRYDHLSHSVLYLCGQVALALILCRHTRVSKQRLPGSCADGRTRDPISVWHLDFEVCRLSESRGVAKEHGPVSTPGLKRLSVSQFAKNRAGTVASGQFPVHEAITSGQKLGALHGCRSYNH